MVFIHCILTYLSLPLDNSFLSVRIISYLFYMPNMYVVHNLIAQSKNSTNISRIISMIFSLGPKSSSA